jgi:DNA-binding transcriptional MerR regulator
METGPTRLPAIPAKRYFTIGEVSELCGVKPYVLRYWEQEFTQLKPMKRRGNRRYYQHHEVLLIRRIRDLLYDQGFTISGARNRLADAGAEESLVEAATIADLVAVPRQPGSPSGAPAMAALSSAASAELRLPVLPLNPTPDQVRDELLAIRDLLSI